jgi:hypothetical protein
MEVEMLGKVKKLAQTLFLTGAIASAPLTSEAASVAGASTALALVTIVPVSVAYSGYVGESTLGKGHPLALPVGSVTLAVVSVAPAAHGIFVVFEWSVEQSVLVFQALFKDLEAGSIAVGQKIEAVSTAAGHILLSGDHVIGFVPNENGRRLFFTEEVTR